MSFDPVPMPLVKMTFNWINNCLSIKIKSQKFKKVLRIKDFRNKQYFKKVI
jgi:hypothetical protein